MRHHAFSPVSAAALFVALTRAAHAADDAKVPPPEPWFIYVVIFVVLVGAIVAILAIRAAVAATNWSLSDALSEEAELTTTPAGAAAPVKVTELRASVSRLIALMGMMAILLMFLGFGSFALFYFAKSGEMPAGIDKAINFLAAGMTLFAPYLVNKFSSLFEGLAPKR